MLFEPENSNITEFGKFKQFNHSNCFISSADEYLHKQLKEYDETKTIHFTSNGRFALHDIIIYYARQYGPVNCIVSSFNISVPAARKFIRAWDNGLFAQIQFILNIQKRSNFMNAIRLLDSKFNIVFTSIHAKVAVIYTKNKHITVINSGNLSSNQNIERGFVSFDKETFNFDYKWLNNILHQ
ncbi:MAG: hypothetical protein U9N34_01575 [Candidatus Cloacimonadota bacterium]|nr:hypothetical protein [Candidatus Cloacimonadota bacterium]